MIAFTIHGVAQPAGSKRSLPIYGRDGQPVTKNGRVIVNTVDANPKAKDWKHVAAHAAKQSYAGPLLQGPLCVSLRFFRVRPQSHYRTGKNAEIVKDSAPQYPIGKPDVLKLARAIEDALTGVIWKDDAQIVVESLAKSWGETARVEVVVEQLLPAIDAGDPSEE